MAVSNLTVSTINMSKPQFLVSMIRLQAAVHRAAAEAAAIIRQAAEATAAAEEVFKKMQYFVKTKYCIFYVKSITL